MKIRTGFVSNSSSSSFVVAVEGDVSEVVFTLKTDLEKYTRWRGGIAATKDELDKLILDEYEYDNLDELLKEEYCREVYNDALTAISNGKKVLFGLVGNDDYDDPVETLIYNNGIPESPGIDILRNTR